MDSADIHYSCLVSLIYKSLLFGSIYQLPLADPTFRGMYREQKLNQNCVGPRITTYLNPRYSRFSFPSNQSIGSRYWLGVANSTKKKDSILFCTYFTWAECREEGTASIYRRTIRKIVEDSCIWVTSTGWRCSLAG